LKDQIRTIRWRKPEAKGPVHARGPMYLELEGENRPARDATDIRGRDSSLAGKQKIQQAN